MRKIILSAGLATAAGLALAGADEYGLGAESAGFVWTPEAIEMVRAGDPLRGREIAESTEAKCAKCHGDLGIAEDDDDDIPNIAGQNPFYAFKQLMDYKSDARENRSMRSRVSKLEPEDFAHLAAWYASLKPEQPETAAEAVPVLVKGGDYERLLLPCSICHGRNGEGLGYEVPALAGQNRQHMIDTLLEYRADERTNDLYGRMRYVAKRMSEEEIEQVADYYSRLGASP